MPKGFAGSYNDFRVHAAYPRLLPTLVATFVDHPSFATRLAKELFRVGISDNTLPDHECRLEFWCEDYLAYTVTETEIDRFKAAQFVYYYREVPFGQHLDYDVNLRPERCPYLRDPPALVNGRAVDPLSYDVRRFNSKLAPHEFWKLFWQEERILFNIRHPSIHQYRGSFSRRDYSEYYFIFANYDHTLEAVLDPIKYSESCISSPPDANLLLQWMLDLSSALACLHGLGLFHRHIKPSSVVFRGSKCYLSDIQLYSERPPEPTSKFDAPEIRKNDPILNRRSDIYSLGQIFLNLLLTHYSVQITVDSASALTETQHESFLSSVRYELESFQSPLRPFQDLILSEMLNWYPNRRPSAVQLHNKIIAIVESQNIHGLQYKEITSNNYPDMSDEAMTARRKVLTYNLDRKGLPWRSDTIIEDLVPDADELIVERTMEAFFRRDPLYNKEVWN